MYLSIYLITKNTLRHDKTHRKSVSVDRLVCKVYSMNTSFIHHIYSIMFTKIKHIILVTSKRAFKSKS